MKQEKQTNQLEELETWIAYEKEIWRREDLLTLRVYLARMKIKTDSKYRALCEMLKNLIQEKQIEEATLKAEAKRKAQEDQIKEIFENIARTRKNRFYSTQSLKELEEIREKMLLNPGDSKYADLLAFHFAQKQREAQIQLRRKKFRMGMQWVRSFVCPNTKLFESQSNSEGKKQAKDSLSKCQQEAQEPLLQFAEKVKQGYLGKKDKQQ